jgi:hypothetical protein
MLTTLRAFNAGLEQILGWVELRLETRPCRLEVT